MSAAGAVAECPRQCRAHERRKGKYGADAYRAEGALRKEVEAHAEAGSASERDGLLSSPHATVASSTASGRHHAQPTEGATALAKMRAMPIRPWLLALLLSCGTTAAAAIEAVTGVYLEELTWTELRDRIKAGRTTIIVPVGGTEQSGPQIVLGKHNVRARVLAGRIAAALGNALVAPVLAYVPEGNIDPPAGHMRFAGTISIPEGAFETTLEHAARSFRQHGFRDIVLIGDHGGYQKNLANVAARLNREWAKGAVRVHAVDAYYRAADVEYVEGLRQQGLAAAEIGSHAGLADTSLSLAIDPRLVRTERLSDSATSFGPESGVRGDPRRASAERGQPGVDLIVGRTRDAIRTQVARR